MRMLRLLACAALLTAPAVGQARADVFDSDCWARDEIASARVHYLQTKLMVDSLKCRDMLPGTLQSYNDFMNKRRDTLVRYKQRVEAHFVRRLGRGAGIAASDTYNTRVGNQVSSPVIDATQCERAGTFARLATFASEDDLRVLADAVAPGRIISDCRNAAPVPGNPLALAAPARSERRPARRSTAR